MAEPELVEAVEEMARALYGLPEEDDLTYDDLPEDGDPDALGCNTKAEFREQARAALQAAIDSGHVRLVVPNEDGGHNLVTPDHPHGFEAGVEPWLMRWSEPPTKPA